MMIAGTAIQKPPGPASARAAVAATQPTVLAASSRFLAAWASAQAPRPGMASITIK